MFSDLNRPGLRQAALHRALVTPGSRWTDVRVVQETGSTNVDIATLARTGALPGLVLVAEVQRAGRGRLDREWTAPPRSGLFFSVLLRPRGVRAAQWGWLPLITGLAVAEPLARLGGLDVRLKWPNDVLVGERKLGGILAERVGDALVVGVGLNVSMRADELPLPSATSLGIEGSSTLDRDSLLRAVLRSMDTRYSAFEAAEGDPGAARADYRDACATLGRTVRVLLPGDRAVEGCAVAVDDDGRLVVDAAGGPEALSAGDVVHVR